MKPLLLVEALAVRNDSGLGRHVRLFVAALSDLRDAAEIRVVLPWGIADGWVPEGIGRLRMPPRPYRFFCECVWPVLIAALRPRVVLCLGQSLPALRPPARYALLVPDAAPLEALPFAASGHPQFNRNWMRRRIPAADGIVTSAAFTRDRLHALLGIAPEKIAWCRPFPEMISRMPGGLRTPEFRTHPISWPWAMSNRAKTIRDSWRLTPASPGDIRVRRLCIFSAIRPGTVAPHWACVPR